MRMLAASLLALSLAACGSSGDGARKPTVEMPLAAPEGAKPIIADFVEICSASLYDREQFLKAVQSKPDWKLQGMDELSPAEIAMMSEVEFYAAEREDQRAALRVEAISFPHLEGAFCSLNIFDDPDLKAADLSLLGEIPGFIGDQKTFSARGETLFTGRWSAIGPNGFPVTLQAQIVPPNNFAFATMATSRPSTPSDDK